VQRLLALITSAYLPCRASPALSRTGTAKIEYFNQLHLKLKTRHIAQRHLSRPTRTKTQTVNAAGIREYLDARVACIGVRAPR